MAAEWEPHAATWTGWPVDDVWFRDSGPTFVRRPTPRGPEVAPIRWRFNAWGGKYRSRLDAEAARVASHVLGCPAFRMEVTLEGGALEVNGAGLGLTTRPCLLAPERNPEWDEASMSQLLGDALRVERWIWLEHGLEGDHTDGHIDTLARFVDLSTIVVAVAHRDDRNFVGLDENRRRLVEQGLRVVELPIPRQRREIEGVRQAESYANFYVANGVVLVPQYGDVHDEQALEILRPLFPDRELFGLPAGSISTGGGAFHCLTQQQPEGTPCDWR